MLREVRLKYTPYAQLKEGDEFIRVGMLPVLLSDLEGTRLPTTFLPSGWGTGEPYDVRVMVPNPAGWLDEVNLNEEEDD